MFRGSHGREALKLEREALYPHVAYLSWHLGLLLRLPMGIRSVTISTCDSLELYVRYLSTSSILCSSMSDLIRAPLAKVALCPKLTNLHFSTHKMCLYTA